MSRELLLNYGRTFVSPVTMRPASTALVIVDMQYQNASKDFGFNLALRNIDPESLGYIEARVNQLVVPSIQTLIDGFRQAQAKIVYLLLGSAYQDLRDVPPTLKKYIRDVESRSGVPDVYWAGSPGYRVLDEIAPRPEDTIVRKTTWGAFNSSNLEQVLSNMGVDTVVITGVTTSCCVETTARDAADRGYGCVIVDEGTADYNEASHYAALGALHSNFGRVLGSPADVLSAMRSGK